MRSDKRDNKDDKEENMLFKEATAFSRKLPLPLQLSKGLMGSTDF